MVPVLRLWKAITQNVNVWNKDGFVDQERASREDGKLSVSQTRLAHWASVRVLRVYRGMGMSKFELEDLGTWPFMIRGGCTGSSWTMDCSLWKGFGVQVLVMSWSFGFLCVCIYVCVCVCVCVRERERERVGERERERERLVSGVAGGPRSLLGASFVWMTCGFGLLSLKNSSLSH